MPIDFRASALIQEQKVEVVTITGKSHKAISELQQSMVADRPGKMVAVADMVWDQANKLHSVIVVFVEKR